MLSFSGKSHKQDYAFKEKLFAAVSVEDSKWNTKGRNIILNISKTEKDTDYWPRLTDNKAKNPHIQVDWARWVDEDEEDEQMNKDLMGGDWDPSMMNSFGGAGAPGGDYGDSDDDEEEEEEAKADLGDLDQPKTKNDAFKEDMAANAE